MIGIGGMTTMTGKHSHSGVIDGDFLLNAYRHGFFPMADSRTGEIQWFSPDPRGIIDLETFAVPRSLRLTMKKGSMRVTADRRFEDVMRMCAKREETWISEDIVRGYVHLYRRGFAHSVETWMDDELSGGLYGVAIGGAFFGESMFSLRRDTSKVALVHLVNRLKDRGYTLLDTQYLTPHLARFAGKEITREEYLGRLASALKKECSFV